MDLKTHWETLRDSMLAEEPDVALGRMMSAEALTYRDKVFAFYSTKGGRAGLGCRVGRETNPANFDLSDWQHLAPFRTKPPMKDWIVIGADDVGRWTAMATFCLDQARKQKS